MASFVLVHGAWYGSWCWKRVRKALQSAGHDVFTPTLTGVADRSHLLSRDVNLDTHIQDVPDLIEWEELTDIVLCGHSYGACVVTGVADRIRSTSARWCIWMPSFLRTGRISSSTSRRCLPRASSRAHSVMGMVRRHRRVPAAIFNVDRC